MKKSLLLALILSLVLAFALVGCSPDEDGPISYDEIGQASYEASAISEELQLFVDTQNDIFAAMNSDDMTILVSAVGNTLIYTYTFATDTFDEDTLNVMFEVATAEGDTLLSTAQLAVPEITTVTIEYVDGDGNVTHTQDFN